MNDFSQYIVDTNGDGIPDDIQAVIVIGEQAGSRPDREFWSALFDLVAMAGLETEAMSLPLVRQHSDPDSSLPQLTVNSVDDIRELSWQRSAVDLPMQLSNQSPDRCLTSLFTTAGMLSDLDGDLVADSSRVTFEIPDRLSIPVGVALANVAARLGLESGGIDLPLVRPGLFALCVEPTTGEASFRSEGGGWIASGSEDQLTALLEKIAQDWPHLISPFTAGATFCSGWLRRSLAGVGPEQPESGGLAWEMQWSAEAEVDRLRRTFHDRILPELDDGVPVEVLVFASEPPEQRRRLAEALKLDLTTRGFHNFNVIVLNAFKAGLSWVREILIPELQGLEPARIEIQYQRYDSSSGSGDALDLPIRWLQELFPADEMLARELHVSTNVIQIVEAGSDQRATYVARAFDASRHEIGYWECSLLSQIQPCIPAFPETGNVCVTTGGLIVKQGDRELRQIVDTDMRRFWHFYQHEVLQRIMRDLLISGGPAVERQPFFEELLVEVWISEQNENLGIREENISGAEALQEDIYFNALDTIEVFGLEYENEKTDAPGAVVPVVHVVPGVTPHARIQVRTSPHRKLLAFPTTKIRSLRLQEGEFLAQVEITTGSDEKALQERLEALATLDQSTSASLSAVVKLRDVSVRMRLPLQEILEPKDGDTQEQPPMATNIHGELVSDIVHNLTKLPTVTAWVEDASWEGRPIPVISLTLPAGGKLRSLHKATVFRPTCLIVARHHANEISSTNAAMQLAYLSGTDDDWSEILKRVNIVILPYENPDGAALHARLASDLAARHWKHHPARYNAVGYEFAGDFFNDQTVFGESRVRPAVWNRFLPDFIVDNHGVPSHEWVQPFAGFGSPPRFNVSYWIPQALIYGIIRYIDDSQFPEHEQAALALRKAVSNAVQDTDIGQLNREIGASYRFWGQSREPERFPGGFYHEMLWHFSAAAPDLNGRGFNLRYPKTTVISWVTEVNDETASGEHLDRVSRAHIMANKAMLELIYRSAPETSFWRGSRGEVTRLRLGRERPLQVIGEEIL